MENDYDNFSVDDVSGGDDYEKSGVLELMPNDGTEDDNFVEESEYEEGDHDSDYETDEDYEEGGYEEDEEYESATEVDFMPFTKAVYENYGYEFDPELMGTNDVDGFITAVEAIVQARSVPQYSSPDVEQFDQYVKNGGDPRDFLDVYYASDVNYDEVDLSDSSNKRAIMKDFLKLSTAFSDVKIERQIGRLEDLDQIDEELEEAIDYLKAYQEEQKQEILNQQYEQLENRKRIKEDFEDLIISKVSRADSIVGFDITKNQKEEFLKYVLAPTREGKTEYQKFIDDPDNAISLAFLAFKGTNRDALVKEVKQETVREIKRNLSRVPTRNNTHKVTSTRKGDRIDYSQLNVV